MQVFSLSEATQRNLSELVNCRCASREELMAVLWRTETVFTKQNVMTVLAYLLNYDLLPELALSGLGNSVPFWKWLADIFPLSQTEYHTSVFPRLMTRISKFVTSQAFESHDGDIQEYLNRQESAGEALQILAELDLRTCARPLNSRKASAKALKKAKNHAEQQETPTALAQFSVSLPTTLEARDQAVASILVQLKQALKLYLKILSTPSAQYTVQVLFLSRSEQRSSQIPSSAVNSTEVMRGNGGFTPMGRLEGFGEWKILVSRRAERNLRDAHRKVPNMFNIIMKKIKELSQGYFTDDNQKRLNGPGTEVPIFEAKMSKDTRLVYQIHCEYDRETKVDEQVIRVFGIFSHAKLGKRLWDSIGCQLGQKGAEYRRRCLYRQPRNTGYGDTVFVPASFPMLPENNDVQPLTIPSLPSEDLEKVHDILVLQQYMVMSEGLLRSILMDIDVTFPFHLSPQESRIVEHKMSSYILGRSGTGKTTCMLYKMIWNEQVYQMHRDTLSRPRQMFVTKSTKLASKVQEDYNKLISSFQFSHSLAEHLALNEQTSALVGPSPASAQLPLPAKFSELEDGHFPLFIPYDKLLRLIEEDYNISPEAHWGQVIKEPVSYKKFRRQYWHHLPQHLTRGMDPTMVFNEIIGVIKGSERTLPPNDRFLDRVTYRDTRTNPTFYGRQEELYSLFEAYQTKKIEFQDYDPADRTHNLLRALRKDDIKGGRLDYLFVDEAQDNLLIDALVLRSLCHNPYGLFWAGDTAQTILAGSSFRFEDLKAFLHRVEQQQSENITPSQHYRIESMSKPSTFQLTVNYRSHKGITDCAHAVIELLTTFWPDSIDILAPERGVVDGVKPVFLTRWGSEANANILTESLNGTSMELGSNQCILVRNEEARDSLRGQLKNATIVSTIYDSKGLEFDDVLLLNFFEDSPCDAAHWRLVLNKVKASGGQHHRAPTFDDIQHVGLCTELKFLYVAITRARKTLWIADRSAKAGPMKDYWLSRDQIIVSTSSTALEKLAVFSSPEDWAIRGEDFFQHEDFATAQQCFERAGQPHRASEANAWLLKRLANEIPTSSRYRRRLGFIEAAQAFLGCVENDHTRRLFLLNEAAQCYALASELTTAADIFLKAQDHDSAATCYLQLEAFGILCTFVPRHRGKISEATISDIRMKACPHYYRQEDFENASRFFASKPQEIEYLKSQGKGWILFLAQVYARIGEAERAARIYIQEDLVMQAIPLLLKCQPGCTQEASRYIVNELWKHVSFSRRADLHPSFGALQAMWDVVDKGHCGPELEEEFRLLQAVSTLDRSKLGPIGRAYLHRKRVPAALLCISHFFEDFPTKTDNAGHVAKILFLFKDYIAALVNVTFPGPEGIDVDEHPMSFYPFGVRNGPSNDLLCLANTFMCPDQIHEGDMLVGKFTRQGFELPRSALKARFRRYLDAYIAEKYQQACEYFEQYIHTHQPCISLSVSAVCHQHVKASDVHCRLFSSSDWLNRIDIILSHSMTMQSVHKRLETRIHDGKSTCMNLLYQALTALSFHRNDIARLEDLSVIDEGRSLVRNWTNHSAFSLDYENPDICLAWFLRASRMRILHCDQQPAVNFMQQIRLNISLRQPYFYSPFRDGPSLGYLIADLERLELDHATDQIERALVVLRIVLQGPYQLDLQVLCRWFEILTGLILLKPLWNDTINLHGRRRVTLPLSVAIQCINVDPHTSDMNRPKQVYAIFDLIEKTMDILFSEEMKERFAFQYDAFTVIPQADISVARICRMYCLIGYNHRDLRSKLLVTFKRLKAVVRPGPSLSGRYSSVTNEQEILSALVSTPSSLGDRLVRLCETGRSTETVGEVQGIKTISYEFDQADQLFERLVDLIKPRGSPEVQNEEVSTNRQVAQGGSTPSGDGPACAMESSQSIVSPQPQEANHDLSSA